MVQLETVLNSAATVTTVFRQFRQLDTISRQQYPCVMIEEDLPEVGFGWKSSGYADVSFQVNLLMAVVDNTSVATAVTALDVEVKKVLANNPTLNGTCLRCVIQPETERLGTQYTPYGMSRRPVTITYEGSAANGY